MEQMVMLVLNTNQTSEQSANCWQILGKTNLYDVDGPTSRPTYYSPKRLKLPAKAGINLPTLIYIWFGGN